jgi:8-oxo-dGTP diphosphatase
MMNIKYKAFAYITSDHYLLLFRHPYVREAGIQVPAGTIEANETPQEAVLREAFEETGLPHLTVQRFLGEQKRNMMDFGLEEIHHRYFYHLLYPGNRMPIWRHEEQFPSDSSSLAIVFEFFWATLPHNIPPLIADHDKMLSKLLEGL